MAVEGASVDAGAFAVDDLVSVVADALAVDVGLVLPADRLAEPSSLPVAWLAEALVRVAVVVVPGRTVGAHSPDSHVLGLADALLSDVAEELVQSLAGDNVAGLGVLAVGFSGQAPGACSLDDVVALGAVALAAVEVVDLVGAALDPADSLVDVVDLSLGALGAEVVDEVVARLADAPSSDEVLVLAADGAAHPVASLSRHLLVALDAVAALGLLVVDLGLGVALRADASNEVESREAPAGADGDVPHLIGLACVPADSVGGVVGEEGRAHSAGVADQVVALLADTHSVHELLVGVAGRGAEPKVLDVALIAHAFLGDIVVGGVEGAGGAGSIGQLEELGQALALLGLDVVDSLGVARDPADA